MGCLLGEVAKEELITAAGSRVGDSILLVGGIPIEGTAIMAREKADDLTGQFEDAFLQRCREFLFNPGISVVEAAQVAIAAGGVHAMHDPTEGGLAAGLWELALAAGCGLRVESEQILILPEGRALCESLGLDPLATIASGALLITASPQSAEAIRQAFANHEKPCVMIGEVVTDTEASVEVSSPDGIDPLPLPERDEIARLFA